jgi:hypothetical protein
MVSFVNTLRFLLALRQCSDFGVKFSRFHGVGLAPHCLLEKFIILAERTEERKIDLRVCHLGCATFRGTEYRREAW